MNLSRAFFPHLWHLAAFLAFGGADTMAQVSIDPGLLIDGYQQNFDTLPSSGEFTWSDDSTLAGWYAVTSAGTQNTSAKTTDGSSNASDLTLYSVGPSGHGERALTYHPRSAATSAYLGLALVNTTGSPIAGFSVAYTAEQWREGTNNRTVSLELEYRVGADPAELSAPTGWTAIPGLSVNTFNGAADATAHLASGIILETIPDGSRFWLRWKVANDAASSTASNDLLAIDDVVVDFEAPEDLAPAFTMQPTLQAVAVGDTAVFKVAVTGTPTPALQWFKNETPVDGATGSVLELTQVQLDAAGIYTVVATNAAGTTTSDPATLTVSSTPLPPRIVIEPIGASDIFGGSVSLAVTATGSGTLTYQWYRDTILLEGANTATLVLDSLTAESEGSYTVTVSNLAGSASSEPVFVHVILPPIVTTPPVDQEVVLGGDALFTVVAAGEGTLSYQWLKADEPIAGATAASLSLLSVAASDAGEYAVEVSNLAGSTLSASAVLTILSAPRITSDPTGALILAGGGHSFAVGASGTAPFHYQWIKDGADIPGATSASLNLLNAAVGDSGSYAVRVSNEVGSATSESATLTVSATPIAPSITTQPLGLTAAGETTAALSVAVTGTAPFTYLWYRNDLPVPGASGPTLAFSPIFEADAGDYRVVITNAGGSITSNTVTVSVTPSNFRDYYVSPEGEFDAPGTIDAPTTLPEAILRVEAGYAIYLRGGTYRFSTAILIARDNAGLDDEHRKRLLAYTAPDGSTEEPVLDFSSQPYGKTSQVSNPRGIQLNGDWWHLRGLRIYRAADNGIYVAGNHNIVERCITHANRDTGIQIGRYSSLATDKAEWPAYNLILNCESYDNFDEAPNGGENADGFAAKLTSGPGNVFRGCIGHHNIDDGWDLYTKSATGAIFPVTIDQCIAYNNGTLTDGTQNDAGDRNGFKLGGEKIAVVHTVTRCIAFGNGKNGFTWNSNPAAIRMFNNLAFDNEQGNYKFDLPAPLFYNNLSLWTTGKGQNDRYGGNSGIATGPSNCFWYVGSSSRGPSLNDQGIKISAATFVTLTPPTGGFARHADGRIDLGDFARPIEGSPTINAGSLPPAETFVELVYDVAIAYEGVPDMGPVETYLDLPAPTGDALLAYAFGYVDEAETVIDLPRLDFDGNVPRLTFHRLRANVSYAADVSENLIDWEALFVDPGQVGERVELLDPAGLDRPARFLRLRVALVSPNP